MDRRMIFFWVLAVMLVVFSCASIPKGAVAVKDFEKERYLGRWYEVARFDFIFEKDLNNTTAEYSLRDDGKIKVVNSGFNYKKNEPSVANGVARFRGSDMVAELEVSFFGPFYSGYNVLALDPEYKYALVVGKSPKYMWILSREKTIPEDVKTEYLRIAESVGCKTEDLVWVEHSK